MTLLGDAAATLGFRLGLKLAETRENECRWARRDPGFLRVGAMVVMLVEWREEDFFSTVDLKRDHSGCRR